MPDPRLKNHQTSKTSRSSGACLACRAKKHKCSGERLVTRLFLHLQSCTTAKLHV
ncbi:hypothetical protein CKAH01_09247 [Colletotrichum kahawae]|uniref:Zn(2)-C6 fungal-type domain-containing protein n=1 Tax=Colletotrichum kahawae TaxID=34407 RepID=A0AAD9Y0L5_COLKA|nr:hypothetical protein CKAH01_09247 [Colletotrichum kahawae]